MQPSPALACAVCGTERSPSRLACPVCGALVHAARLQTLVAAAEQAHAAGHLAAARAAWSEALTLLPDDSRQRAIVNAKIAALGAPAVAPATVAAPPGATVAASATSADGAKWAKRGGPLGALGLLLWKLKFFVLVLAGKLKLLALGLTKISTLFSILLSFGVYWTAFGWKFAAGLILSIYVHEIGHVAALRQRGIAATAPMFIPGVGAFVRLHQYPKSPADDARVGLAGPLWGLGAAVAFALMSHLTGVPLFRALARCGAWMNLFNLVPVWQLDGARAFHALSRAQRFVAAAVVLAAWLLTGEGLLLGILLVGVARAFAKDAPGEADHGVLAQYSFVIMALAALAWWAR